MPSNPIPFLKFNLLACFRLPFSSLVCFLAVCMSVCLCVIDSLLEAHLLFACALVSSSYGIRRSFYSGLGAAVKIFPSGCFYGHFSSYVSATVFLFNTKLSAVDPALPTIKPWLIYNVFFVFV